MTTPNKPNPPPTYTLQLRPEGDGPPPVIRLRSALKVLKRAFGLRCIRATEDPGQPLPRPASDLDATKTNPPF